MLFLIVGVLRETSKMDENQIVPDLPPGHVSAPAAAALQALRSLIGRPVLVTSSETNERELDLEWVEIMRSTLLTALSLETSQTKIDKTAVLLAVAVFLVSAPIPVTCCPDLQAKCVQLFRDCLLDESLQVWGC